LALRIRLRILIEVKSWIRIRKGTNTDPHYRIVMHCVFVFSFQKAFKQIAATIKLCFVGLSTFVLEFAIVFGAFCCYFFFMLSPYMDTFRDMPRAVENTIAMAIGKFSFATLRAASNFAAWIFFLFSGDSERA